VLRRIDIGAIGSYQITATGRSVGGQAVLIPLLRGNEMEDILDIFQGDATIEGSPIRLSEIDDATSTTTADVTTTTSDAASDDETGDNAVTDNVTTDDTATDEPTSTEPAVGDDLRTPAGESATISRWINQDDADSASPDDNTIGWVPDASVLCD